jgi:hypothetical protein
MKNALILLISSIFWVQSAFAILEFEDHAFPELVTSSRALALGNAYLSKADDPWAVFYNPAGLGTVRKPSFTLGQFHFELNKGFLNLAEGEAADTFKKLSKNFTADGLRENIQDKPGTLSHARLNLFPNFTTRYFSMGYLFSQQARARYKDETSPMEFSERRDHGPLLGVNLSFLGGVFKVGATGTYLFRNELKAEYPIGDTITIDDKDYKKGSAFVGNVGSRLTLPLSMIPTFSFVLRNAGDTEFKKRDGYEAPDAIKQTMDVGFSITPQIGQISRMHIEINYRDIGDAYSTDQKRRIGMGVEFDMSRMFFVRFGYGDGFGSAGIGVRNRTFNFDLTTYAVDLSPDKFRGEEDRRFVLSIGSGI